MSTSVESATPSAVIDRISLVLDGFDEPGPLALAQTVRRTALARSSAHRMLQLCWLRRSGQSLLGFGCVAATIGHSGEPVATVSVCGPIDRMRFDQRLTAPVRMTAMGIWCNLESDSVPPTLQPLRPLCPALQCA